MKFDNVLLTGLISLALLFPFACTDFDGAGGSANRIVMEKGKISPDDGDSFMYGDAAIRVLGMDTPEIKHEEHGFFEDQPFGREASAMAEKLFNEAQTVEYIPCSRDKYGRTLAHVFLDGELLAVKMIRLGLAYETVSFYGDNGYPELAEQILKAAREGPEPAFEPPYKWRKKQRKSPQK